MKSLGAESQHHLFEVIIAQDDWDFFAMARGWGQQYEKGGQIQCKSCPSNLRIHKHGKDTKVLQDSLNVDNRESLILLDKRRSDFLRLTGNLLQAKVQDDMLEEHHCVLVLVQGLQAFDLFLDPLEAA